MGFPPCPSAAGRRLRKAEERKKHSEHNPKRSAKLLNVNGPKPQLHVLNLCFHVVDGVRRLNVKRNGLASQGLDKDLHPTAKAKHQVQCRLLLDVVVRERAPIFKLLASEDQALLVGWDSLLVLRLPDGG